LTTDRDATTAKQVADAAALLCGHPDEIVQLLDHLDNDQLANVAEVVRGLQRGRAIETGDFDHIIAQGFEVGFGRDGLGMLPWVEGEIIVCPGAIVSKSRTSHRCRFVSVDDIWIWDSGELLREDKRSAPGPEGGFRAVALLPLVDGLALDVVSGKARGGQHSVDRVVSFEVRQRQLVEVSQRVVAAAGMH